MECLWTGIVAEYFRCGMMTSCQLASYDTFRDTTVTTTGIYNDHPARIYRRRSW